jgi:hypothetical protein
MDSAIIPCLRQSISSNSEPHDRFALVSSSAEDLFEHSIHTEGRFNLNDDHGIDSRSLCFLLCFVLQHFGQ